jgi:hypothetical protein
MEGNGHSLNEHYPGICLEEVRKPTETLRHENQCPSRDFNREHPELEFTALSLCQRARSDFGFMQSMFI